MTKERYDRLEEVIYMSLEMYALNKPESIGRQEVMHVIGYPPMIARPYGPKTLFVDYQIAQDYIYDAWKKGSLSEQSQKLKEYIADIVLGVENPGKFTNKR